MAIAIDRAHPGIHDFRGDMEPRKQSRNGTSPETKPKKLKRARAQSLSEEVENLSGNPLERALKRKSRTTKSSPVTKRTPIRRDVTKEHLGQSMIITGYR